MKLNVGCGRVHEPNYYNIDLYDDLVADEKMSATDLKIEDNCCEEVKAIHLIEHLGLYQTIYAISEFFRVLKPSGKLIFETPDLKKAMQIYLKLNYEKKKDALNWIYGLPHRGMQHKLCFPPQLLSEILKKIGFDNIHQSNFFNEESIPTIRFVCNKPTFDDFSEVFQMFSSIRKKMYVRGIINFNDFFLLKEQEDLMNLLLVNTLNKLKSDKSNLKYIKKGLISSPQIVQIYLYELRSTKFLPISVIKNFLRVSESLIKFKFQSILYNALKTAPIIPGSQRVIYTSIESFGLAIIDKILYSKTNKSNIASNLNHLSENLEKCELFFSPYIAKRKSLDLFYQGIKFFHKKDYNTSLSRFLEAIRLYRDDFLYFWNLAKVNVKINEKRKAIRYYKKTLKFLNMTKVQSKAQIREDIKKEIYMVKNQKANLHKLDPVSSLVIYQSRITN